MSPVRTIASPQLVKGLSSFKKDKSEIETRAGCLTPSNKKRVIINDDARRRGNGSVMGISSGV